MTNLTNTHFSTSHDLLDKINELRVQEGQSPVRRNDFNNRIIDEIDEFIPYETFVSYGKESKVYQLSKDQCMLIGMRESKGVRKSVLNWIKKLEANQLALPDFNSPVEAARAWADAKESEQKLLLEAKENAPKINFYNQVTDSKDAVDMASAAKVLNLKGIGRNKLFQILRDNKVLQENNQPYQSQIDAGRFRVIESKFTKPNGDTHINIKTVVYQKGLDYILKLINKKQGA